MHVILQARKDVTFVLLVDTYFGKIWNRESIV
jgi:hypothetical protein